MSRRVRLDQTDSLHHVMTRTVERRPLFEDDTDRVAFLDAFSGVCSLTGTRILAWALMGTHIHLLARCADYPLSGFMQQILSRYARYFNWRHDRTGHLFEDRFRSILVNDESYLLSVIRYIHLNPVASGMVDSVEALGKYPWTGHRAIVTGVAINGQDIDGVLALFGGSRSEALSSYLDMMGSDSPAWEYAGEGFILGRKGIVSSRLSDLISMDSPRRTGLLGDVESSAAVARSVIGSGSIAVRNRAEHEKVEAILSETLSRFDLNPGSLTGSSRNGAITEARAFAAKRLVTEAGLSFSETGRLLGMTRQGVNYLLNCKSKIVR